MNNVSESKIQKYLEQVYGKGAKFRNGQLEAIRAVLSGKRALVVQKTGWGKSLIYFLSTRILRDQGAGPCIIISPLLALMNNQIESAEKFGLKAATINSNNKDDWNLVKENIRNNQVDVLFISPERLANEDFMTNVINKISGNIGMLVIDEAHCISDWGHDFRPDYRRITNIIQYLTADVPLLATTATANDRVIEDVRNQLGKGIFVLRGDLTRESLYIQVIHLDKKEERLAWLIENIYKLQGAGIIYCLTVSDCYTVSNWLRAHQIDSFAYTGKMQPEERQNLENMFINNQIKVLVATIAFGMGIDKPDIGFVIHFQKPGNLVSYYQQIGRAGRNIDEAYAILLAGEEDNEINEYFINSAFPTAKEMVEVVESLMNSNGLTAKELVMKVNMSKGRLDNSLKFLLINGDIYKDGTKYYKSPNEWKPDLGLSEEITKMRYKELEQMDDFINLDTCYMEYVTNALNDVNSHKCGHCGNCLPDKKLQENVSRKNVLCALSYLKKECFVIEPRKQWPGTVRINGKLSIAPDDTYQAGYALSNYGDAGWGRIVREDKYKNNCFSQELIDASYKFLEGRCKEWGIQWITAIPSLRRPDLVPDFAKALAKKLNLPYYSSIIKRCKTVQQKELNNSFKQYENAQNSFEVTQAYQGNVLLDMVDSRWTLTVCANKLVKNGSGMVFPFALANTAGCNGG